MRTLKVEEVSAILQCSVRVAKDIVIRLPHCEVGTADSKHPMIRISEDILNGYLNGNIKPSQKENQFIAVPKPAKRSKQKIQLIPYRRVPTNA